jgi:hypothetical protein
MHECPECGQVCVCDCDDTWFDDLQTLLNCSHKCENFHDDDDSGYYDFLNDIEADEDGASCDAVELSVEQTGAGLTVTEDATSEKSAACTCPRSDTGSILYFSQRCAVHRAPCLSD